MVKRTSPNIIITGTPGVGKTTHAELLAQNCGGGELGLKHLAINQVAKERDCYDGKDEELGSWIVDEDKLLDAIEPDVLRGGNIIDWHACDLFPRSWIDLVVVVRADSTLLYDRLKARGYDSRKLNENMDAEIMQVLLDEARDAFDEQIVVELRSDSADEVEQNCERIEAWVRQWVSEHKEGVDGVSGLGGEEGEEEDDD